ncbi:histidine kinase-like ATPase [Paraphysoderma sedebokerense]|nr:histidine kinase-like ATPase [Paraphysoderma sedebokerense]
MDAFTVNEDVKVAYYIQEGTPQSVMGDETRLRQIITNLVSNAIKFTSKGYVLLFVSSDKAGDDEYGINFRIIDTGCGIASDKVDKIFQRFEQEDDSITRKFGGTGLGLSICQNLCELMGSHITVTSELNHGSQFTFSIRNKHEKSTDTSPSRFFHTLDTRSKILLFQSQSFTFESKSILEYQLVSMGSLVKSSSFPISNQEDLNVAEFDAVIVDCTDLNLPSLQEHLDSLFKTTLLTASRVLVFYSASQCDYVTRLAYNRPNVHLIQYPHKQSGLFRQVASYLKVTIDTAKSGEGGSSGGATQAIKADGGMSSSPTTSDVGNIGEIAILLVEDNLVNQKVIQKMISRLGLKKDDLADNGLIATEMVQKNNYDLILMDVRMPSWMVWRQLDGSECITKT